MKSEAKQGTTFDTESFLITAQDEMQAGIIESLLHSFDIRTARNYRGAGSYIKVITGMSIYGIDIFVPSSSLDKAREIVKAGFPENAPSPEPQHRRAKKVTPLRRRIAGWLILAYLISMAVAVIVRFVH